VSAFTLKENNGEKKHIYSGLKLTEKGADIIVISLSALLVLFLVVALLTGT
jgi:hypothetical protein